MDRRRRNLGISTALASLALAGATTATAGTQLRVAPAAHPVSVRAAATHAQAAAKAVRIVRAVRAAVTTTPKGYVQITSSLITAANGTQTSSSLSCPIAKGVQTVPLDGGAVISSSSLFANINSSLPNPDGISWRVDVNNASGADTTFTIYVVCAKAFKRYAVLSGVGTNLANTQTRFTINCPAGSTIVGGGALSSSGSTAVNLNGDWPSSKTTWEVDINNATSVDENVTVYEVCAKLRATAHYRLVGPTNPNPPGSESNSNVPARRVWWQSAVASSRTLARPR